MIFWGLVWLATIVWAWWRVRSSNRLPEQVFDEAWVDQMRERRIDIMLGIPNDEGAGQEWDFDAVADKRWYEAMEAWIADREEDDY